MSADGGKMTDFVQRAVEILAREMKPRKIILFGSTARDEARPDSDLDFLVVMEGFGSRLREMRRASAVLAPLKIATDVLVYSEAEVEQWGHVTNHVINEALLEGRVVYDAA